MEPAYTAAKTALTLFWWMKPATSKTDVNEAPPKFEKDIEPFSLIVDLALASFLPDNSRPTLKNHHIIFDLPGEWRIGPAKFETQGTARAYKNFKGEEFATRNVVKYWNRVIEQAIFLYPPTREVNEVERSIYEKAYRGALKVKRTYERLREQEKSSDDSTPELLDACMSTIKNALERDQGYYELTGLHQKVGNIWSKNLRTIIKDYLDHCTNEQGDTDPKDKLKCQPQIKVIQAITEERCLEFEKILQNASKLPQIDQ